MQFPVKQPSPDFQEFEQVLKGQKEPDKVYFAELQMDREVMEYIIEHMMGEKFCYLEAEEIRQKKIQKFKEGHEVVILTDEAEKIFLKRSIELWYKMGHDYFKDGTPIQYLTSMVMPKVRRAQDTAALVRKGGYSGTTESGQGLREWVEEGRGIITSWEDLEKFPWERMKVQVEITTPS